MFPLERAGEQQTHILPDTTFPIICSNTNKIIITIIDLPQATPQPLGWGKSQSRQPLLAAFAARKWLWRGLEEFLLQKRAPKMRVQVAVAVL